MGQVCNLVPHDTDSGWVSFKTDVDLRRKGDIVFINIRAWTAASVLSGQTLPTNYIPARTIRIPILANNSNTGTRMDITSGVISFANIASTDNIVGQYSYCVI